MEFKEYSKLKNDDEFILVSITLDDVNNIAESLGFKDSYKLDDEELKEIAELVKMNFSPELDVDTTIRHYIREYMKSWRGIQIIAREHGYEGLDQDDFEEIAERVYDQEFDNDFNLPEHRFVVDKISEYLIEHHICGECGSDRIRSQGEGEYKRCRDCGALQGE